MTGFPSRRPSIRFAQLEVCEICNRLRDNTELRESIAHPGLLACADHPEEFNPGHKEYQEQDAQTVISASDILRRWEPFGAALGLYELEVLTDSFFSREDGTLFSREASDPSTGMLSYFLRETGA